MCFFLHSKGYTYFTIPKLTYPEISALVESYNRKMKKQEKDQKRIERKSRVGKGRRRFR